MGKAAALGFAKEGAHVCINDISEAALAQTVEEISSAGGSVTAFLGDANKRETCQTVVDRVLQQHGRIDILFNYVGGFGDIPVQTFIEDTEDQWREMLDLNLVTAFRFSRAVLDGMVDRRYGKIISTSSIGGKVGLEYGVIYSAAKGGVIAFTKALAREVGAYGINVNCVCPNTTATPTMSKIMEGMEGVVAQVVASTPLQRMELRRMSRTRCCSSLRMSRRISPGKR